MNRIFRLSRAPRIFHSGPHSARSCVWPRARHVYAHVVVAPAAAAASPIALEGDIVTLHYVCSEPDGTVVDTTRDRDEPLTLELGVGSIIGNPLATALEQAVAGHGAGDVVTLELSGGDYRPDLVFRVPLDHEEVQRLQGRYSRQGGLQVGSVVELRNGGLARVLEADECSVVLDANNMLAGARRVLEVEVLSVQHPERLGG